MYAKNGSTKTILDHLRQIHGIGSLPTDCEEMKKYAAIPKGLMLVVLIKIQNALESIQPVHYTNITPGNT